MGLYLKRRLEAQGRVPRQMILQALSNSLVLKCSVVEALLQLDARSSREVSECFAFDGEAAQPSWRRDPLLDLELPPGLCERYLSFPFRRHERGVDVATLCPADEAVREEFEVHLRAPVWLYRAELHRLLVEAGASVDMAAVDSYLGKPIVKVQEAPVFGIRKFPGTLDFPTRNPTQPGVGMRLKPGSRPVFSAPPPTPPVPRTARVRTWVSPQASPELRLSDAKDLADFIGRLGAALPAPALIFHLGSQSLSLRFASGPGAYGEQDVSLQSSSAFRIAAQEGSYVGAWSSGPVHDQFMSSFSPGTLVRVERIGSRGAGLIIAVGAGFDAERAAALLMEATTIFHTLSEKSQRQK